MKDSKLNAYTLMEVTLAMLLSAICITVCYTAYGLIGNYYKTFSHKNESTDIVLSLRHVLDRDFLKGKYIVRTTDGIEILSDTAEVEYVFNRELITRSVNKLHVDTFKVAPLQFASYFEGHETLAADTLDEIRFSVQLDSTVMVPLGFHKKYSAYDLF